MYIKSFGLGGLWAGSKQGEMWAFDIVKPLLVAATM